MKKYISNLLEYVGERGIITNLIKMFNIDENKANELVSYLDFGDYVELDAALKRGDEQRARVIIGKNIEGDVPPATHDVEEGANAYSSAPSTTTSSSIATTPSTTTSTPKKTDFKVGDKVTYVNDDGKSEEGEIADDSADGVAINSNNRQKILPKDQLTAVEEELNRILELSGMPIEERKDRVMGPGKFHPPSAIHSASMTGACMPQKKLRDITRTKKDMKPGPKTK